MWKMFWIFFLKKNLPIRRQKQQYFFIENTAVKVEPPQPSVCCSTKLSSRLNQGKAAPAGKLESEWQMQFFFPKIN